MGHPPLDRWDLLKWIGAISGSLLASALVLAAIKVWLLPEMSWRIVAIPVLAPVCIIAAVVIVCALIVGIVYAFAVGECPLPGPFDPHD